MVSQGSKRMARNNPPKNIKMPYLSPEAKARIKARAEADRRRREVEESAERLRRWR